MSGADRISALPLEIKVSILCCLDVKHAIRMSALARSWHHVYTLLPSLCLGYSLDQLGETPQNPVAPDWVERVHHLISSLRGPFLIFKLSNFFSTDQSALLQSLLDLLIQKGGVQNLSLSSYRNRVQVHLPFFHFLKVLRLSQCHVVLPANFQGFNRLTTMTLRDVEISNLDLHLLIHTSTNLTKIKFLDLVATEDPLSVNISLPFLRHLEFGINVAVNRVCIVSAPCLEEAHIFIRKPSDSRLAMLAWVTLGLLTSVATVSSLNLDCGVLKSLSLVSLPFNLTFPRLRCLKFLLNMATMDKRMYNAFIWLLRSMTFLEELEIKLTNSSSRQTNRVPFLIRDLLEEKQDGLSCLNQTLKGVTISMDMLDAMTCITMVKFLLSNANVLKLIKIQYDMHSETDPSVLEEYLQKANVASSEAKVVILRPEKMLNYGWRLKRNWINGFYLG